MSKYCLFLIVIYYLTGGNNSMSRFFKSKLYTKRDSGNQRSTLCQSIGGAMDAKQLEKMMGFAPGELEKAAEAYEKDE